MVISRIVRVGQLFVSQQFAAEFDYRLVFLKIPLGKNTFAIHLRFADN